MEIGTGVRKVRLYSSADAIFIAASSTLSDLKVQPKAAAVYAKHVVDEAERSTWTDQSKATNRWFVLDGLEFRADELGTIANTRPQLLADQEVTEWADAGAVLLNVSKIVIGVLSRLEQLRLARLEDRGKTIPLQTPEQAAYQIRRMDKSKNRK